MDLRILEALQEVAHCAEMIDKYGATVIRMQRLNSRLSDLSKAKEFNLYLEEFKT